MFIFRPKTPPQKPPRRRLDYTPSSRGNSRSRSKTPPSVPNRRSGGDDRKRPLEMTGNVMYNDDTQVKRFF